MSAANEKAFWYTSTVLTYYVLQTGIKLTKTIRIKLKQPQHQNIERALTAKHTGPKEQGYWATCRNKLTNVETLFKKKKKTQHGYLHVESCLHISTTNLNFTNHLRQAKDQVSISTDTNIISRKKHNFEAFVFTCNTSWNLNWNGIGKLSYFNSFRRHLHQSDPIFLFCKPL